MVFRDVPIVRRIQFSGRISIDVLIDSNGTPDGDFSNVTLRRRYLYIEWRQSSLIILVANGYHALMIRLLETLKDHEVEKLFYFDTSTRE